MTTGSDNLIAVGRILGTHGIKGQLRLHSYSGNLASLQTAKDVYLRSPAGVHQKVLLKRAAYHSGKILLTLDGFNSIEQVQGLTGFELYLHRDQLPAPDTDEYYWQDLLGMSVITNKGQTLGTIKDILETGANDVYLVHDAENGREYLIPAISQVVISVSVASKTMVVAPLEGLLDL
jgi:16S rRNA processing protein RimM